MDNGTEFPEYAAIERATPARFYFATPHHAWERGTNENTNGLLRQYLPRGQSYGAPEPTRVQPPRGEAQPSASHAARLPHPGGVLCLVTLGVALQT
ncbi:MAG: hypothetical protein ACREOF_19535 [Gemmatimonadales bacterium]